MKLAFYNALKTSDISNFPKELEPIFHIYVHSSDLGIFMGAWYSYLYVVIEGYKELELHDIEIDELINSDHVDRLRRFRNSTFHYQKEWLSHKTLEIFENDLEDDHVDWVQNLHLKLGAFISREIKKQHSPEIKEQVHAIIKMLDAQQFNSADS